MAGEAEADEPLLVEATGHLLQNRDAPRVVLDQVVVGGEDGGDAALLSQTWQVNLHALEQNDRIGGLGRTNRAFFQFCPAIRGRQPIMEVRAIKFIEIAKPCDVSVFEVELITMSDYVS